MPADRPLAITGVRVWSDAAESPSDAPWTIRVERGRIAAAGPELDAGSAERLDLDGAFAIPGLIDAHVHLWLDPEIGPPEDQAKVSAEARRAAMEARALAMLRVGITTARDLGGPDASEIALRDRIARGELPGPRLLCAGQPVTTRGGHCHFWGGEAESDDEIAAVIDRQVERGCDWVKVMATGGVITKGTRPRDAQYPTERLAALVAHAARGGRRVAAHAHGTEGIRNATEAGVATVEHCSFVGEEGGFGSEVPPELVTRIAEQGVAVSPTINAGWRRFEEKDGKPTEMFERVGAALRALREAGVPLVASTDAGIPRVAHDSLPAALEVFARWAGMRPVEVLRSATSTAAEVLGLGTVTGRVAPGLSADLLVVDGDPTASLDTLTEPVAVIAAGRRVALGSP